MRLRPIYLAIGMSCAALGVMGCDSSGLPPREMQSQDYSALVYADYNGQTPVSPETRPSILGPIGVAVVEVGEVSPPRAVLDDLQSHHALFLHVDPLPGIFDAADPEPISAAHAPVKTGEAAPVIADDQVARRHINQMRHAALDLEAQYLLLIGGTIDHSSNGTAMSALNLTIIGAFVAPSQELHATGRASASLIDARTGRVIFTVSSDALHDGISPAAASTQDERRLVEVVRQELLKNVADAVIARLEEEKN